MAAANGGERAVEVGLDGADGQVGDLGDVGEFELLDEAEEEDGALALGERRDGLPDLRELVAGDDGGLGGAGRMRQVRGEVVGLDGGLRDVAPEAEAVGAGVIAQQVEGDAGEPGGGGTVAAELVACGPGAQEGLLGEGFGGVAIAGGGEQETEDALTVQLVQNLDGGEARRGSFLLGQSLRVEER